MTRTQAWRSLGRRCSLCLHTFEVTPWYLRHRSRGSLEMADFSWIDRLAPSDFERLVMRLLWRWGFYNVQRVGGPGDRGRDLTAECRTPAPRARIDSQMDCSVQEMAKGPVERESSSWLRFSPRTPTGLLCARGDIFVHERSFGLAGKRTSRL